MEITFVTILISEIKILNTTADHHSNNTLVSDKFLVSEMKMNCQESVHTDGQNTEEGSGAEHVYDVHGLHLVNRMAFSVLL